MVKSMRGIIRSGWTSPRSEVRSHASAVVEHPRQHEEQLETEVGPRDALEALGVGRHEGVAVANRVDDGAEPRQDGVRHRHRDDADDHDQPQAQLQGVPAAGRPGPEALEERAGHDDAGEQQAEDAQTVNHDSQRLGTAAASNSRRQCARPCHLARQVECRPGLSAAESATSTWFPAA
jgi:hypothetical protein